MARGRGTHRRGRVEVRGCVPASPDRQGQTDHSGIPCQDSPAEKKSRLTAQINRRKNGGTNKSYPRPGVSTGEKAATLHPSAAGSCLRASSLPAEAPNLFASSTSISNPKNGSSPSQLPLAIPMPDPRAMTIGDRGPLADSRGGCGGDEGERGCGREEKGNDMGGWEEEDHVSSMAW